MTQEEKARAYDEALSRASKLRVQNPFDTVSQMMEHVFPELAESDDERIRKRLICGMNTLKDQKNETFAAIPIDDCIAWLEKQGQVKESKISQLENKTSEENNNSLTTDDTMIIRIIEALQRYMPTDELLEEQEMVAYLEKQGKSKWSNEDSLMIDSIIDTIKWLEGKGTTNMKLDWLKSLKQRMGI